MKTIKSTQCNSIYQQAKYNRNCMLLHWTNYHGEIPWKIQLVLKSPLTTFFALLIVIAYRIECTSTSSDYSQSRCSRLDITGETSFKIWTYSDISRRKLHNIHKARHPIIQHLLFSTFTKVPNFIQKGRHCYFPTFYVNGGLHCCFRT